MYLLEDRSLPNWSAIRSLIPPSTTGKPDLHTFLQAHETTYRKFKFAIYHLTILEQVYGPNRDNLVSREISDPQHWAIAEAHSIIFNLYSSLDGVSDEINLAYDFRLKANDTGINNKSLKYMINYENDTLTSYLETCLFEKDWFKYFIQLRNRMVHRSFTIFQLISGSDVLVIQLPDDPNVRDDEKLSFSKRRDLLQYCQRTTEEVRKVVEGVYPFIMDRVKRRYGI